MRKLRANETPVKGEFRDGVPLFDWLMPRPEVSAGAKLCYGVLARQFDEREQCARVATATIAATIAVSERSAYRFVEELVAHSLIERSGPGNTTPEYRFLAHPWQVSARPRRDE